MTQVYTYLGNIGIGRMKFGEILDCMFYVINRLYELKIEVDLDKLIGVLMDITTVYKYNKLDQEEFAKNILFEIGIKNFDIYEIFESYNDFYLTGDEISKFENTEKKKHYFENCTLSLTKISYDFINFIQTKLWKYILLDFKRNFKKLDEKTPCFKSIMIFNKEEVMALYLQTESIKEKRSLLKKDIINWVMYQGICAKEDISFVSFEDLVVSLNIYL